MIIHGGTGNGFSAKVDSENRLFTKAVTESALAHISHEQGLAFSVVAADTGPAAGEYTVWLQYDGDDVLLIDSLMLASINADVVWKIHQVTGTGATAASITAINLNGSSGKVSNTTVRGGAGGVTALTSTAVIAEIFGGGAYNTDLQPVADAIVLGKNDALAIEYDAGTGGRVAVTIVFHEDASQ